MLGKLDRTVATGRQVLSVCDVAAELVEVVAVSVWYHDYDG